MGFRQGKQASFSARNFRIESSLYQRSFSIHEEEGLLKVTITMWERTGDGVAYAVPCFMSQVSG